MASLSREERNTTPTIKDSTKDSSREEPLRAS